MPDTSGTENIMRIHIVLDRLRSAHNVGNIFRLAEATGAAEVVCCGYTPAPPHPKLAKTAMGTDLAIPCRVFATAAEAVAKLKEEGCTAIAVDTLDSAEDAMTFHFPEDDIALVFGNEALGITPEAVQLCDKAILLPMSGTKASINVGNCAAVILFLAAAQNKRKSL